MKLGPVTKLNKKKKKKKKKKTAKKIDDDVLPGNFDVIVIFPIYGLFGGIWKLDSGCIVCKIYIFFLSYKN